MKVLRDKNWTGTPDLHELSKNEERKKKGKSKRDKSQLLSAADVTGDDHKNQPPPE